MKQDPEATQLRELAEDQRVLRLAEMNLEIVERTLALEKQRTKVWKERADAVDARLDAVERIVLRPVLWFCAAVAVVAIVVEAARFFFG